MLLHQATTIKNRQLYNYNKNHSITHFTHFMQLQQNKHIITIRLNGDYRHIEI